ncbi:MULTISPECIES: NF038122 family metalloprotease [unclassified Bradyrhizobium]
MRTSIDELLSDDPFYTVVGNSIQGSYFPDTAGTTPGSTTTTGSVMSVNSGGITINLILDAAAQAAPASFKNGLQQAVAILAANITDKITVNINIDYSGTGGGAAAGPDSGLYENYSWVHSQLVNHASSGDTTFNSLPSGTAIQGQTNVAAWNAQLKLWGVIGANDTTTDDASAYFSTDINPNQLVGVALHELTHAMGRVPYGAAPDVFDFYRFTGPGVHLFSGAQTAPAAYFSLDGGSTKLADYGQSSDPSDFLNSGVQGTNDPFNEYYTSSTIQGLTAIDLKQLDALGFHVTASTPVVIESFGSTSLVQSGNNYCFNPVSGGTGPTLKYNGSVVTVGEFGNWTFIGAEQTASGYEVALHVPGSDQYTVWNTDSNGTVVSNGTGGAIVSGSSLALEALEPSFHQDLNGDGVIGLTSAPVVIESFGSTSLVQYNNNFYFNPVLGGTGPTLKYSGSVVTAGQFGSWTFIGAEQTASGYEVALHLPGSDQYTVWNTDSNGTVVSNGTGGAIVSGSSSVLEALEPSFHQDLNGDGVTGLPAAVAPTTIESFGSTSLVESGNNYYFNPVSGGTGPTLKYNGSVVTAGQFGSWTFIGAEQTASGYEVALHVPGSDQYTVWNTDSNGTVVSNGTGGAIVSGSSSALEALEPSFHQDLNGDGVIGLPAAVAPTTIESFGSTSLVQSGNNYYFNPVSGGTEPTLKYNGSVVTVGEFGNWTFIGAEQTASGYEVALHLPGSDQYTVWNTDSNGSVVSNGTGGAIVSDSSWVLEALEPSFHQDLNGDGVIGVPPPASKSSSSVATYAGGQGETSNADSFLTHSSGVFGGPLEQGTNEPTNTRLSVAIEAGQAHLGVENSPHWTIDSHSGYLILH